MRRFAIILLVLLFGAFLLGVAFADPENDPDGKPCGSGQAGEQNPHCKDTDGDGLSNHRDDDDDGDGVNDADDPCPEDQSNSCSSSQQRPGGPGGGDKHAPPVQDCTSWKTPGFGPEAVDPALPQELDPLVNEVPHVPPKSVDPDPDENVNGQDDVCEADAQLDSAFVNLENRRPEDSVPGLSTFVVSFAKDSDGDGIPDGRDPNRGQDNRDLSTYCPFVEDVDDQVDSVDVDCSAIDEDIDQALSTVPHTSD